MGKKRSGQQKSADGGGAVSKKIKQTTSEALGRALENVDVADAILGFLDVKSLLSIARTRKSLAQNIRHEHVVRSALLKGGFAKENMERICGLVEDRIIWIPSPLRLLRLVNGKRCERCNARRVNVVSDVYGVFFCSSCFKALCVLVERENEQGGDLLLLQEPRFTFVDSHLHRVSVMAESYEEVSSGERCGPLLTMDSASKEETIQQQLANCDASDPQARHASAILETYSGCIEIANHRQQEEYDRKIQAKKDNEEKRKTKVSAILETVSKEIGDHPLKEAALAHEYSENSSRFLLRWEAAGEILAEFTNAPSKATKKKLKAVALTLREQMDAVADSQFSSFEFLSDTDPLERAIKAYAKQAIPNHQVLWRFEWGTFQRIADAKGHVDQLLDELEGLTGSLDPILASVMILSLPGQSALDRELRKGAKTLADVLLRREGVEAGTKLPLRRRFNACMAVFPAYFKRAVAFLQDPETISWKESYPENGDIRAWRVWQMTWSLRSERSPDQIRKDLSGYGWQWQSAM